MCNLSRSCYAVVLVLTMGLWTATITAQSPSDLLSDIQASDGFFTVVDIEDSYNSARRAEELQLGLGVYSIADLDMPDQHTWDYMSREAQALFLLNDERTARACIDYGSGPVLGLPFEGVGHDIGGVAQHHAWNLLSSNTFSHCDPWYMNCAQERVDHAIDTACQDPIPYVENLYRFYFSEYGYKFPKLIAQAIYIWNYVDAGSGWEHRQMSLYQGFTDDTGDMGKEGIIGIGVEIGGPYYGWNSGAVLTFNYYDPVVGCHEYLRLDTDQLPSACGLPLSLKGYIPSDTYSNCTIDISATVESGIDVTLRVINGVNMYPSLTVDQGGELEVSIAASNCN